MKQTDEAVFDEVMAINYKALFFLIKAVADRIRDNGRIINVSTGFTRIAAPTYPAYAASKGALETLTLALAPEFSARGITVNAVLPGVTETDMNAEWLASPDARAGAEALSVFSRVGKPEDVADVIAFLASNEARDGSDDRCDRRRADLNSPRYAAMRGLLMAASSAPHSRCARRSGVVAKLSDQLNPSSESAWMTEGIVLMRFRQFCRFAGRSTPLLGETIRTQKR